MSEDRILLEGMVFFGRHGDHPAERELGQRFAVDVELSLDLRPAGESDDLSETVSYSEVYQQVRRTVEGEPASLIETVAGRIARAILDSHPPVTAVRVRVAKPQIGLGGSTGMPAVEIVRRRADPS